MKNWTECSKLMGQMEDILYEIKKPTIAELQQDTGKIIERLRTETNGGLEKVT